MEIAQAGRMPDDPISAVVGSAAYSAKHSLPGLRLSLGDSYRSSSLTVSRYYFDARVVVDVIKDPSALRREIDAKRAYCVAHNMRYVVVQNTYDAESVRHQLSPQASMDNTGPVFKPRTTATVKTSKSRRPRSTT